MPSKNDMSRRGAREEARTNNDGLLMCLRMAMFATFLCGFIFAKPPGGYWKMDTPPEKFGSCNSDYLNRSGLSYCAAGTPILLYSQNDAYMNYMRHVGRCLLASLAATSFVVVSFVTGFSNKGFIMKLLPFAACVPIIYVVFIAIHAQQMILPPWFWKGGLSRFGFV